MPQTYKIAPGDTLSGIAKKFGYGGDYQTLARANNIANPNLISAGATITIPDRPVNPTAPPPVTPAPAPVQQPVNQAPQQPQVTAPGGSAGFNEAYLRNKGYNDPNVISQILANPSSSSIYQDFQRESGGSAGGASAIPNVTAPTIDLQSIYDTAFRNSGVSDLQAKSAEVNQRILARQAALNEAKAKINDNPFYSEATRVGRLAKLDMIAGNDIKTLQNELGLADNAVSTAKADAQVRVNLAAQQYNIDSAQYTQKVNQINTLLTSGSLNGASSSDIAQIALSTGMSTSMVQSIINSSKAKENKPQLVQVDDGKNQKIVAVDSSGNIISQQILGASTKIATATSSDTSGYTKTSDKYLNEALNILKTEDTSSNNRDKGDKLLSKEEALRAYQRILALVGSASEAQAILDRAWSTGGYNKWNW